MPPGVCIGLRWSEPAGHVTCLVMARGCELVQNDCSERGRRRCVAAMTAGQKVLDAGDLLSQAERFRFSCNIVYLLDRFLVKFGRRVGHIRSIKD